VILAIVGPTASGKSDAALQLAGELDGEIVACDSMQIYRGLDVGTAKPTAAERARMPHHLLDVANPDETFSAARFAELADRALGEIAARGKVAIVCGGTGLYFRALRWGLFEAPPRDQALRDRLYADEKAQPGVLHERLRVVDPQAAAKIAPRDHLRLVRALEVHTLTGVPLSQHHAQHEARERHPMAVAVLDPPRALLDERIEARTRAMLAAGLVDETRRVRERWGAGLAALQSVGYAEASQFLDGKLSEAELPQAIVRATRGYARRQRTWFKKERDVRLFQDAEPLISNLRSSRR
jgi:tRNA dimethylallyltransferase